MRDLRRAERGLAAGLATVAGFVDAVGFLTLGGFFVSFMSGNSTGSRPALRRERSSRWRRRPF